jgi:4,5:9,10-diseco-3-hydroxy-5,9,17-trioxoandrosta-1(10),2-diene-4-oate hydrolase
MNEITLQDQYVKVNNVNTRYWVAGSEGPVVILIHGIGCAVDSWVLNINAIAQEYRVYALDLVGFGKSDKPEIDYSFSNFAKFVKDFMGTQNIDRASLVGWSLGGGTSLQFAIDFPDKLDKLVLLNSVGLGKEIHLMFRMSSIPLIGKLLSRPSKKGTARLLKECVFNNALITDELVDLYYQFAASPGGHDAWLATLQGGVNFGGVKNEILQNFQEHFSSIKAPTLIIWGKQDRVFPFKHAQEIEKWLPNAEVHVIEQCGHCPQFEHPEAFNARVIEFLNR